MAGTKDRDPFLDHRHFARACRIEYLENTMKRTNHVRGRKVTVLGLGKSGIAACRLLSKGGAIVFGSDSGKPQIARADFTYETGGHSDRIFDADLVVVSPGIPTDHPVLKEARERGVEIIGEIELAAQHFDGTIIAVTGTNGKTTTAALMKSMLDESGMKAALGGNIAPGFPLSEVVLTADRDTVVVAEISTFQLETIKTFKPHIGIITNISPDHLDRHKDFDTYVGLKRKLFVNQSEDDFCILNFDQAVTRKTEVLVHSRVFYFSIHQTIQNGTYLSGDTVYFARNGRNSVLFSKDDVLLPGMHNLENVLAASTAAMLAGCDPGAVKRAVRQFSGVPHRLELVRKIRGVTFINNSMCTNPVAFKRSLEGVPHPFVLICGGRNKNLALEQMVKPITTAKFTVIIGESSVPLSQALKRIGYSRFAIAHSMGEATSVAAAHAESGDTVLLSPGGSSFDMFEDFADRGEQFKESVRRLTNGALKR
jgi:UDP-N-acetylmuramoylalanine--D-glutamate ligase